MTMEGTLTTGRVLYDVAQEREYQRTLWTVANDDRNSAYDWWGYVTTYFARALNFAGDPIERRRQLVKCAALFVAAIEAHDRAHATKAGT